MLKKKIIKWGHAHIFHCSPCFEMERMGYQSENKYWDDFFARKLKPIKYVLIKGWGKDKGKKVKWIS